MSDDLKFPGPSHVDDRDSLGEPLTGLLRDAYTPVSPTGSDAYWTALEQRIMARVTAEGAEPGWWLVLAPWARAGLIAATAIFALASVINQRISDSESQYAYESVVRTPANDADSSAALLTGDDRQSSSDAAVDYLLSH